MVSSRLVRTWALFLGFALAVPALPALDRVPYETTTKVGPDAATLELLLEDCNDDPAWIRSVRAAENPFGAPGASDRIARAACEVARRAASKRADSRGPRT